MFFGLPGTIPTYTTAIPSLLFRKRVDQLPVLIPDFIGIYTRFVASQNSQQDVLSFVFEDKLYKVLSAYDGDGLDKKILEFRPDVILLGIILGFDDGLSICSYLKNLELTKNIPVILLTAGIIDQESLDNGQDAIIEKPFEIDHLLG